MEASRPRRVKLSQDEFEKAMDRVATMYAREQRWCTRANASKSDRAAAAGFLQMSSPASSAIFIPLAAVDEAAAGLALAAPLLSAALPPMVVVKSCCCAARSVAKLICCVIEEFAAAAAVAAAAEDAPAGSDAVSSAALSAPNTSTNCALTAACSGRRRAEAADTDCRSDTNSDKRHIQTHTRQSQQADRRRDSD